MPKLLVTYGSKDLLYTKYRAPPHLECIYRAIVNTLSQVFSPPSM